MKKRKLLLTMALIIAASVSGCTKPISLTDQESNMIAEYVAGTIVRNEENYTEALVSPTPSPTPTPAPTPTLGATGTSGGSTGASGNMQANADFSEVVGMKGITLEYVKYDLANEYFNGAMSIQADKNKQLLKVAFRISNTSQKDITVNLSKLNIKYQLDTGSGIMIKPLFSILDDDLRYMEEKIKAGTDIMKVVLFSVPEKADPANMKLLISKDDKTAIVKLKE